MFLPHLEIGNRIQKRKQVKAQCTFHHAKAILNGNSDILKEETFKNESHSQMLRKCLSL
jgi:hypothetical protein